MAKRTHPPQPEPPAPKSVDQIQFEADRDAFLRVKQAEQARQSPKRADVRAAGRYEQERDTRTALKFMAAVKQKYMREWAGVQTKQIHDVADRYGAPVKGPTFSVPEFVRWVFRFLARYGRQLKQENEGDELLVGPTSPALEDYRREKVLLVRVERMEREKSLIPLADVQRLMQQIGSRLRSGAQILKQQCEPRAFEIYSETIDDCDYLIDRFFDRLAEGGGETLQPPASESVHGNGKGAAPPLDA